MAQQLSGALASSLLKFREHTQAHHTRYNFSGRVISPKQCHRPDNKQQSQTSMCPEGFEPAMQASERPQTQALNRVASGIVNNNNNNNTNNNNNNYRKQPH